MKEAAEFAESTQILMNVSEFTDISTATDTLISAVQAFGYTAETSMEVVDLMNIIGNNYAISTADLATSLTKSSASLVAAGGNLAEAAALTATANAIIQDADSVGTALKTTSLRLRGTSVKVLEEEGLDSDGVVESTSKLRSQVMALSGVDILTDTGAYKSTYQILLEIAEVWDQITDDKARAGLLELLAGKRNSSVIAALLQNPEDLKAAYEDAMNAEGSALRENEKYLDSIQGKIDQFNNAVQSLWSNILDADWVKGIVEWATKIVKSLDTTHGKILAIVKAVALLMAYKKVNPLDWIKDVGVWMKTIKDGGGLIQWMKSLLGLAPVMKVVTAETVANTIATQANNVADQQAILEKIGLAGATGTLNAATKEAIANNIAKLVSDKAMTVQMGRQTAAMLGYTLSVDAAGKATVAADVATKSFIASNPIGWILLAVTAVMALVMWVSQIPSKIEKLTEELKDLQSELDDIKSELESVNSELETTQDRMAELLAKDKLSFTEKEELDNLRKTNDELQRKIDLLELQNKNKVNETANKFVDTMDADVRDYVEYFREIDPMSDVKNDFLTKLVRSISGQTMSYESEEGRINRSIEEYQKYVAELKEIEQKIIAVGGEDTKEGKELAGQKKTIESKIVEITSYIDGKTVEWNTAAEGLYYGINEKTDTWLDYIRNFEDKWSIIQGGSNAKTNAISRIFNKDENAEIKASIDEYVEALKNGDVSAKAKINNIIRNNTALVEDLRASGIEISDTVNEAADYFTALASEANYETIEGKVKEIEEATKRLNGVFDRVDTSNIEAVQRALRDDRLINSDGKVVSEAVAEYFGGEDGGISEKTRSEIEHLIQQIYDGKISVDDALKQFEYFGVESTLDIYIAEVQTNFKDVFVELEDVDGLIDTFEELGEAIGSTASALKVFNKAEAEMANSGRVSIETALQLMEYTDDYGSILQVVDGKLQLVDGAEETLIQTRIDSIRTSAEASLAEAQAAYEKAQYAVDTYQTALSTDMSAEVVASAWQKVLAAGSGLKAGIDALLSGGSWTDAYNNAYNTALSNMTGYETSYDDAGLQSLVDARDDAKNAVKAAEDRVNLANQLTPETLESINDADDVDTVEEVADDAFQREMDYWENRIAANQAKYEQLQNEIDLLEAKGQKADASYYGEQIKLENERLTLLEGQKKAALARLQEIEAAGGEGNEQWWEAAEILNSIEGELDDVTASIVDLQDAIGEIDTYKFEEFNTRISNLTDQLESVRNLLTDEDEWFSDEGEWTEDGVAALATYIQQLEIYKDVVSETGEATKELEKYQLAYAGNEKYYESLGIHSEQEYYDKFTEAQEQYSQYLEMIDDTEDAIVGMYESSIDAVEEYTETLIDGYNDYIDSVKEALDAERDCTL